MQPAKIECPWCGMETHVADIVNASVHSIDGGIEPEDFLEEANRTARLAVCENRSCWAPCEIVLCANTKVEEDVRRLLSRVVWSTPRRVPVRNEGGVQYSQHCAVVFNRKPLERWREIRLSSLVNVHLIAKLLAHHAHVSSSAVTLFEAWATLRDEETFWLQSSPPVPEAPELRNTAKRARHSETYLSRWRSMNSCETPSEGQSVHTSGLQTARLARNALPTDGTNICLAVVFASLLRVST